MKTDTTSSAQFNDLMLTHKALLEQLQKSEEVLLLRDEKINSLQKEVDLLKDYLRLERQHRFGRKSEKMDLTKTPVFPALERIFDDAEPESIMPVCKETKEGKKHSGGRKPLPQELPRDNIIHEIAEDKRICACGHTLHNIGQETSEQLEVIPAQVKVLRHVRYKYGCKSCQDTVLLAPLSPQPIPKSMAGPGLLAHTIVAKYADHLPLYRQEQMWDRVGVDLDRVTLGRWMMACGELLSPLVDLMKKDILKSSYIQADETPLQVLSPKGRLSSSKFSYMWVYLSAAENPKVVYQYSPTRSSQTAQDFLEGFTGYLQSDAYAGYKRVAEESKGNIVSVFCWAHARRKFADIIKSSPKAFISAQALSKIEKLYEIEKEAKDKGLSSEQIKQLRQEKAKPLLQDLKTWLEEQNQKTPPKGVLAKAIGYSLGNWTELTRYINDGRLQIDNNGAERQIKPFVLGRKNWLFTGNEKGAEAGAVLYSLIQTCKSYGINLQDYFTDILKKISEKNQTEETLKKLLPYHWNPLQNQQ